MIKAVKIFLLLILFMPAALCQDPGGEGELLTITGETLIGRTISGEMVREVSGNVVITQGDIIINCNKAIQYISRNDAELIGDVVVRQHNLTITTPHGFYKGDERIAESNAGVILNDQKVILSAKNGEYYFNEDRAYFVDSVRLYDTATTLTSYELTYYKNENRSVAVNNVKIVDADNIIEADSLEHFRDTRITFADQNVKVRNFINNVVIYGNHLEDYAERDYSLITDNPLLIQIDTTYFSMPDTISAEDTLNFTLDTLIIKSLVMEAYRDTGNRFIATDSVEIVRGNFASKNPYTIYFKDEEYIVTGQNENSYMPVIWHENTQLTGDSITIFIRSNKIELLEVSSNGFIISQSENYPARYDQISGERIFIYFTEGAISKTEVFGNVYSIYFMFEEDESPNGLTKSTSQDAVIAFESKQVNEVRLYGSPKTEYHPEQHIFGKEFSFTLPGFNIVEGRPLKDELLNSLGKVITPYEDEAPYESEPAEIQEEEIEPDN